MDAKTGSIAPAADLGDRTTYLGASDVPAVAGLNPHRGPLQVFLEKTRAIPPFEGNIATRMGLHMEPLLAALYEEKTGRKVTTVPEVRHPEHDFLRAHLDRVAPDEKRDVELKVASIRTAHRWGPEGSDQVPEEYLLQATMQMHLAGLPVADIAVLFGNEEFRVYTVPYDRELAEGLVTLSVRFWLNCVVKGEAPALDASEAAAAWLARKHPTALGHLLTSSPDADEWARRLRDAKAKRVEAEQEEETARNNLCALIGDARGIQGEWGRVQWTNNKGREQTDWKAVCMEAGVPTDLVVKHTTRKPYRVFQTRFTGEDK